MREMLSNTDLHRLREFLALIAFAVLGGLAVRWMPRMRPRVSR